jgi:hypothetical protein
MQRLISFTFSLFTTIPQVICYSHHAGATNAQARQYPHTTIQSLKFLNVLKYTLHFLK